MSTLKMLVATTLNWRLIIMAATIAAAFVLAPLGDAFAQRGPRGQGGPDAGYCPAGTCAKGGGKRANNVKNCSAANCQGGSAATSQGNKSNK